MLEETWQYQFKPNKNIVSNIVKVFRKYDEQRFIILRAVKEAIRAQQLREGRVHGWQGEGGRRKATAEMHVASLAVGWRRAHAGSRVPFVTYHIFRKYIEITTQYTGRSGQTGALGHASEGLGLGKEVVHSAKRKEKPAYKIFIIVVFIVAKPEYDPRD